jgi:hypothetical protein
MGAELNPAPGRRHVFSEGARGAKNNVRERSKMTSNRLRVLLLSLLAVFAVSGIATATASAKRTWWYNNAQLAIGVQKEITAETKAGTEFTLEGTVLGSKTIIKCKKITLTHSNGTLANGLIENIAGPTGRDKEKVTFTECTVNVAGCTVTAVKAPPGTEEGETALAEDSTKTKIYDVFKPNANKVFATITFSGASCIVAGTFNVTTPLGITKEDEGGVAEEIVEPETCLESHESVFPKPMIKEVINWKGEAAKVGELKFAGNEAKFFGNAITKSLPAGSCFDAR